MKLSKSNNSKNNSKSIYTRGFWVICVGSMLFSSSYNMLIPELPGYLRQLGGEAYIGLIISLFTLTAGLSRPFSGRLTDTIGRKPVMVFGALVCIICGVLYPLVSGVAGFLLLRLFHGFSTGFSPTAITTYVSDIVPANRLGEAIGVQSVFFVSGLALGPAIGSSVKLHASYDFLFYFSAAMAVFAAILMMHVSESLDTKQKFNLRLLKISKSDIFAKEVWPPALITFLIYLSFGVILTLIPDWSDHLNIRNKGLFFIVFTIASLLIRFIAGKVSDRIGRIPVIIAGLITLIASLLLLGLLKHVEGLILSACLYGLAMGVLSPALNAWTIDLSLNNQRGKAIATMYIALEAGIGLGALCSGWYYQNTITNIPMIMYGSAGFAFLALVFSIDKLKINN